MWVLLFSYLKNRLGDGSFGLLPGPLKRLGHVDQREHFASVHKALGPVLTPERKEDKKSTGAQGSWRILGDLAETTGREPKPVLDGSKGKLLILGGPEDMSSKHCRSTVQVTKITAGASSISEGLHGSLPRQASFPGSSRPCSCGIQDGQRLSSASVP